MEVGEEGGGVRKKLGADIISAVRGSRPIGSGSAKSSGGDATQCQPEPAQTNACAVLVEAWWFNWTRALSCCSPAGSCYSRPLCLPQWRE